MKLQMTSGNLLLVFIHSLFMLLFGCAIGMHWRGTPATALCLTILGAALWFSVTAAWTRMGTKAASDMYGVTPGSAGHDRSSRKASFGKEPR
jgi:hypothetical protein